MNRDLKVRINLTISGLAIKGLVENFQYSILQMMVASTAFNGFFLPKKVMTKRKAQMGDIRTKPNVYLLF